MNRKPGYGAKLRANLEPTKGVGRLRQQDGGHGSRNPLRSVLPTLESTQSEVGSSGWKSTARRAVSGAPPAALENPEDRVPPTPGRTHNRIRSPSALNVKVKKFNQARVNGGSNYDSLKSESGLEATRVPAACLPTSSRGLGPQRHVSLAKLVRRTSRAGRLELLSKSLSLKLGVSLQSNVKLNRNVDFRKQDVGSDVNFVNVSFAKMKNDNRSMEHNDLNGNNSVSQCSSPVDIANMLKNQGVNQNQSDDHVVHNSEVGYEE
ncbi:hypothetical protein L6452_35149 [Arctium lappa]|uniref:Uncharacterized protein n=1 Tax=Arctium lappa TaxID=4217 RepID=A0ACB8YLA2_ARCLA|nr:hypothetical protein L6452_35149 [Arctium lappa]